MKVYQLSTSWCGPCKSAKRKFEELNSKYDFEFIYVDVEQEKDHPLLEVVNVRSIPHIVLMEDDGTILKQQVGGQNLETLLLENGI